MNIHLLINYLQNRYKIIYSNGSYFQGVYYVDLGIVAPENPFLLDALYSSGADENKEIAILKAIVEMIERIIFISPLVGPIEFFENIPYIRDDFANLVSIDRISPHFSCQPTFSSKGLSCHPNVDDAKKLSIMEYYEKQVLECLNSQSFKALTPYNKLNEDEVFSKEFSGCTIDIDRYFFTCLWHRSQPEYVLGSACAANNELTVHKAFIEANGKWEKIQKNECKLTEIADFKLIKSIKPGKYFLKTIPKNPQVIKRHHNILLDLNLFMYQSV